MIHNVRMYVRMYVCPEPYNLPNRNRYEKSVITKKLRIDKIRCNEKSFFQNTLFFGLSVRCILVWTNKNVCRCM